MRRTVERLVGIDVLAVHALDLSEIVAPASMLFAGGWWRVHFTCGSPYILIPTSAFTVAPLVARKVERLVRSVFVLGMPLSSMTESVARGTGRRQVWGWRSLQSVPRDAAPSGVRVRRPRPGRKPVRSVGDPCRFSFTPEFLVSNVRVLAEARFGADSQEPLVRPFLGSS